MGVTFQSWNWPIIIHPYKTNTFWRSLHNFSSRSSNVFFQAGSRSSHDYNCYLAIMQNQAAYVLLFAWLLNWKVKCTSYICIRHLSAWHLAVLNLNNSHNYNPGVWVFKPIVTLFCEMSEVSNNIQMTTIFNAICHPLIIRKESAYKD